MEFATFAENPLGSWNSDVTDEDATMAVGNVRENHKPMNGLSSRWTIVSIRHLPVCIILESFLEGQSLVRNKSCRALCGSVGYGVLLAGAKILSPQARSRPGSSVRNDDVLSAPLVEIYQGPPTTSETLSSVAPCHVKRCLSPFSSNRTRSNVSWSDGSIFFSCLTCLKH